MLFNVLCVVGIVYFMAIPFILAFLFVWVASVLKDRPVEVSVPFVKPKSKAPEPSEMFKRNMQILANIDAYDGTSKGQKPIK